MRGRARRSSRRCGSINAGTTGTRRKVSTSGACRGANGHLRSFRSADGGFVCRAVSNRFEFAQANSVVLIDEFDQTFNDVLPFWALPPSMIANRSQTIQADPNAITLKIIKGKVEVAGTFAKHPRALDQSGLMKRWAKYVDDVNITMSGHDGPSIMMDWETRQKHIDAAKAGKREFATAPGHQGIGFLTHSLPIVLTQEEADGVNDDAA